MENQTAKKPAAYLSELDVWAMAFGCMVGWGAFVMPGTTFLPVAGPAGTVIAMAAGALIMLVIGCNFVFLMNRSPGPGGVYSYTKEAFGRDHAFLSSWFLALSYLTIVFLNGTALFIVLRTIMGDTVQTGLYYTVSGNRIYLTEIIVSVSALAGVGILFMTARSILHKIHTFLSVIMMLGVLITAVICIPHAAANHRLSDFGSGSVNTAYGIYSIVFLAPWAFVGFDVTAFDTANFRFRIPKTKRILFTAIIFTALAYTSMAIVGVSAVPDDYGCWQDYISDLGHLSGAEAVPTFYAAETIMGRPGLIIISITALAGVLTGIIGGYRATIRVLSAMAEDRILSRAFSKTIYSALFIMTISIMLALVGRNTLSWFVDLTSFGAIVGFGYTSAAAYRIARKEHLKTVRLTGLAGTVLSVFFVIVQLVPRLTAMEAMGSQAFLLLSFWCLLGFVFYWRTVTRSTITEYSGIVTSGVVLFALLLYSAFLWLAKRIAAKESAAEMRAALISGGIILMAVVFSGLLIMIYVQNLVRKNQEAAERDKIRAVEGNLAKSRFLFNMSHDIRTPMNAIIGYTRLAMQEPGSEALHNYLVKIDRSNQHLLTLINDILEMSRIENGRMELENVPADLCRIFDNIYELFEEQMKQKKMQFAVDTSKVRDRFVWCDEKNLNRVIMNLLNNAYKFTPEGGRISVSVIQTESAETGMGAYEIRIADNGIGMSKEFAEKMFRPFERERTSTVSGIEGTGLGLSITKSLTDLMRGTIEVLTEPGQGTEIILRLQFLPAEESDLEPETAETAVQAEQFDLTGKRLLLAEDNAVNMEIAKMILMQAGFEVDTAENGQIALDMLSASKAGYYAAVLMDIQMPVMDGYTAARRIRALNNPALAEIPILAMTANAFKEDAAAAKAAGMQAHIAKPIDADLLIRTLKETILLHGGT
ncbi:MAG: amino acid permease [Oscillospiraceae bacterium]|nr:amino acid permease [Oscillospiraceae bacterium]